MVNAENFVLNNMGQLHLSEQKWKIQYVLNLTEYKETSKLLQECVDTLNSACSNKRNQFCSYFEHATKNLNTEIETDISKLNHLIRHKRFIIFIPILIGITVLGFYAGMEIAKQSLYSLKEELQENLNMIEQAANITTSAIDLQEK